MGESRSRGGRDDKNRKQIEQDGKVLRLSRDPDARRDPRKETCCTYNRVLEPVMRTQLRHIVSAAALAAVLAVSPEPLVAQSIPGLQAPAPGPAPSASEDSLKRQTPRDALLGV